MIGRNHTVDDEKVARLKAQGCTNAVIARRLGVTQGAIYHSVRRHGKPKNETLIGTLESQPGERK